MLVALLFGEREDIMMILAILKDTSGVDLGVLVLKEKTFKTGSEGFFGVGKCEIDGVHYQCQAQMVRIRSGPETKEDKSTG